MKDQNTFEQMLRNVSADTKRTQCPRQVLKNNPTFLSSDFCQNYCALTPCNGDALRYCDKCWDLLDDELNGVVIEKPRKTNTKSIFCPYKSVMAPGAGWTASHCTEHNCTHRTPSGSTDQCWDRAYRTSFGITRNDGINYTLAHRFKSVSGNQKSKHCPMQIFIRQPWFHQSKFYKEHCSQKPCNGCVKDYGENCWDLLYEYDVVPDIVKKGDLNQCPYDKFSWRSGWFYQSDFFKYYCGTHMDCNSGYYNDCWERLKKEIVDNTGVEKWTEPLPINTDAQCPRLFYTGLQQYYEQESVVNSSEINPYLTKVCDNLDKDCKSCSKNACDCWQKIRKLQIKLTDREHGK